MSNVYTKEWFITNLYLYKFLKNRKITFNVKGYLDGSINDYFSFILLPNYDYIAELLVVATIESGTSEKLRENSNFIIASELILKFMEEQGWIEE